MGCYPNLRQPPCRTPSANSLTCASTTRPFATGACHPCPPISDRIPASTALTYTVGDFRNLCQHDATFCDGAPSSLPPTPDRAPASAALAHPVGDFHHLCQHDTAIMVEIEQHEAPPVRRLILIDLIQRL